MFFREGSFTGRGFKATNPHRVHTKSRTLLLRSDQSYGRFSSPTPSFRALFHATETCSKKKYCTRSDRGFHHVRESQTCPVTFYDFRPKTKSSALFCCFSFTSARAEDASRVCAAPAVKAVFQTVCSSSPLLCPWPPSGLRAMRVVAEDTCCLGVMLNAESRHIYWGTWEYI